MKFRHPLVATAAFVLLSSQAFAQADPHHPEEDQPPVATGSAAPVEGAAEEAPAPSSQVPAPAAPSSAQQQQMPAQAMPMMQMLGQMQMMHMQQMHEIEMMHIQQMHQMETMHAMQMRGMQMHGMMPGMEMMQDMEMMPKRHGGGMPSSDSSAAEPAPMGDAMAAPTSSDPDVAFVQSMIPHHEGAIAMAEEVLRIGDDEQVQAWAREIIAAQQAEIAEMRAWLDSHPQ